MNRRVVGKLGEELALAFYEKKGFSLVWKNYQIAGGEIDLILENEEFIVFCEVKLRRNHAYGTGGQAVTPRKQQAILRTAKHFLFHHSKEKQPRFDVIEILAVDGKKEAIEWFPNAFLGGEE